eukprot:scaffold8600_cov111-Cylindrotheca_fusiformis.AAC.11
MHLSYSSLSHFNTAKKTRITFKATNVRYQQRGDSLQQDSDQTTGHLPRTYKLGGRWITDSDHYMLYFSNGMLDEFASDTGRNKHVKDTGDVCKEDCSRSGLFRSRGKKRLIPSPRRIRCQENVIVGTEGGLVIRSDAQLQ